MTDSSIRSVLARSTVRPVHVLIAAAAMAAFLITLATAYTVYDARAEGDSVRQAIPSSSRSASSTSIQLASDQLADRQQFNVVLYQPLTSSSPVPPGVPSDLAPGEVALSPALARDGAGEGIETRYGRAVAHIAPEGLSAVDERLAYVRARPGEISPNALSVDRFAGYSSSPWSVGISSANFGESSMILPLYQVMAAIVVLLGLPAVSLLLMYAFVYRRRRAQSDLILRALGAPAGFRRGLVTRGVLPSALAGVTVIGATWVILNLTGFRVPYIDFELSNGLIGAPGLVALGASLLITVGVFTIPPSAKARAVRPTTRVETLPAWVIAVGPVALVAVIVATDAAGSAGVLWRVVGSWLGVLITVVAMPASAAAALALFGRFLGTRATRRGEAVPMLAGAWLASAARQLWVVGIGLTVTVTVALQAAGQGLFVSQPMQSALHTQATVGPAVAVVENFGSGSLTAFEKRLGPDTVLVSGHRQPDASLTFRATCQTWSRLGADCEDGPTAAVSARPATVLSAASDGLPSRRTTGPPTLASNDGLLLLIHTSGQALDLPRLKQDAHETLRGFPTVDRVASGWVDFGRAHSTRWIVLWSGAGLLLVMGTIAVGASITSRRNSRQLAPVLALWGHSRRGAITTVLAVGFPLLVMGLAAVYTSWVLVLPTRRSMEDPAPLDALTGCAALGMVGFAAVVSVFAARQAAASAATWRNGQCSRSGSVVGELQRR